MAMKLEIFNEEWTTVMVQDDDGDRVLLATGSRRKPGRRHTLAVLKQANREWDKIGRKLAAALEREEARLRKPAK